MGSNNNHNSPGGNGCSDSINLENQSDDNDDNDPFSPYDNCTINCETYDLPGFTSNFCCNKNISLMSLNIQSIAAKFNELEEFLTELSNKNCNPDVLCLQELWKMPNPEYFALENYQNLVYKSRSNNVQGGGVGIFVKNGLKFKILDKISIFIDKVIETFFIEIELNKKEKIIIGSIYRPNSSHIQMSANEQLSKFHEVMATILTAVTCKGVYILGDINIDVLKFASHKPTENYIDMLLSFGCIQLITKPTRITHSSATVIDHILTNVLSDSYVTGVVAHPISDHLPVFMYLDNKRDSQKHKFSPETSAYKKLNFLKRHSHRLHLQQ
jgi:hypothetical protein